MFRVPQTVDERMINIHYYNNNNGKIQGDGRKFLDRFKNYFGSQISSQSLNDIHICRLQPKSATKGEFFCLFVFPHIFWFLIVTSRRLMLPSDPWPSFPLTMWTLPYADFGKTIVLTTERSQIAIFSVPFSAVFNCRSLFNEAAYLAALRPLRSPFAIRDADSKQAKTKIYDLFKKKKITFCCGFRL